jgi:flagellar hook-basal body complex protein FliE
MVDKINPAIAANAYANTAKTVSFNLDETNKNTVSFGDLMKNAVVSSIDTMKFGETMTARAVTGEANLPEVVQAVNAAELTLQTVTAVRDRLIGAYQEIMRSQM